MQNRLRLLAASGVVLIIATGSYFAMRSSEPDACMNADKPTLCFSMKAHHMALSGDLEGALRYAVEVIAPYSRNAVHMAMHMIGHVAYEKFQNRAEAMAILPKDALSDDNLLTFEGYQHGVLQSYFTAKKDSVGIDALIEESCGEYYSEENPESDSLYRHRRQCFHAVGHGLMTALDNDIQASIAVCRNLPYPWMTERCAYGAYMELGYLYAPDYFPNLQKKFVQGESMAALCTSEGELQETCSGFVGRSYFVSHPEDYEGTFKSCDAMSPRYAQICRTDVAQFIVTGVGTDFEKAKEICREAGPYEKECLFATAKAIQIGLAGSPAQRKDFCMELDLSIRAECASYVQDR